MQEIALFLTSIAGVATAAAVKKFPKSKQELVSLGASPQIQNQINSLRMEKEILTKTISRLYQSDAGLTKIQRDKLLLKYQHQLGIILARIEKLEAASKHPDMGPVGDGLITLMDQKLSQLDQRLYELSSKIAVANVSVPQIKKPQEEEPEIKQETKQKEPTVTTPPKPEPIIIPQIELPSYAPRRRVEFATLTEIPNRPIEFPLFEKKQIEPNPEIVKEIPKPQEQKPEPVQTTLQEITPAITPQTTPSLPQPKPEIEAPKAEELPEPKPKPKLNLPAEDESEEDDTDDLEKIKGEIMKTLSKLEQAEVE
ncbi:hypothetical protein C6988_03495 [Nitrosopumilus sp. b1]|uniref:hypothetical protein n=1 Tax=Nitrosopumilus sp. b1 TaxID=2109907 RepID=UPI0015F772D3|nr:hypothetical protein [Nitrosopumilus sp. b1]KAF6243510.1 hypothetical protein C6988_03495 [Nitrosopumilus sp. b1]